MTNLPTKGDKTEHAVGDKTQSGRDSARAPKVFVSANTLRPPYQNKSGALDAVTVNMRKATAKNSGIQHTLTVPRELFEALIEEACELRGLSEWKSEGEAGKYRTQYDDLCALIERAKAVLNPPTKP